MAIYRFRCRRCGHEFEFMKIRSDEVAECEKCEASGDDHLEKLMPTKVSHELKGGGWYKDGYSSSRKKRK